MSLKQTLVNRLRNGVRVPFTRIRMGLSLARVPEATPVTEAPPPIEPANTTDLVVETEIIRDQILFLAEKFPELKAFLPAGEVDRSDWMLIYDFINDYIPLIHPEGRETQIRRLLHRLRAGVESADYRSRLTEQVAHSDFRHGVIERATALLESAPDIREELKAGIQEFERQYEADVPLIENMAVWRSLRGDVRANSLIDLFGRRPELLRGKRILHIAPEADLKAWILERKQEWNIEYESLNGFGDGETYQRDIGSMSLPPDSYDLVICHRVLEHIVDDTRAIAEIYKVMRPGAIFNVSVPQSMHLEQTKEWVVPDYTHALHIRQYGRDFTERLRAGGFREINVEYTLLRKTLEEHKRDHTYPMRIYDCVK